MKDFSIIAGLDQNIGISKEGQLPWYLPEHLKNFSRITKINTRTGLENVVLMGRNTWENLAKGRSFPNVINAVISSRAELDLPEGVLQFISLDEALLALSTSKKIDQVFVIGGGQLFAEAILHPSLDKIYLTRIEEDYDCDLFFPEQIPEEFEIISTTETMESDGLEYAFMVLGKITDAENEFFIPEILASDEPSDQD